MCSSDEAEIYNRKKIPVFWNVLHVLNVSECELTSGNCIGILGRNEPLW